MTLNNFVQRVVEQRRRASVAFIAAAVTATVTATSVLLPPPTASAQEATAGTISGSIEMRTAGAVLAPGSNIELIELQPSGVTSQRTAVSDEGSYEFAVTIGPETRYVPRIEYQGVQYFGPATVLSAETPNVEVDPIAVYESTGERPGLRIEETVITAIAIDRGQGQLGFIRDDLVVNPTDRAYVGGDDRVTLRLPVPEGTLDAAGENADGTFALSEGVLTTTTPIRASAETSIITRFLVEYDVVEDEYVLRVTVPVGAERIVVRVPEDYAHRLRPEGDAYLGDDETLTAASGESVLLRTVILEDARPGDSLVVTLDGLAIRVNRNPLAEAPGSIIAAGVAFIALAAGGIGAVMYRRREALHNDEPDIA